MSKDEAQTGKLKDKVKDLDSKAMKNDLKVRKPAQPKANMYLGVKGQADTVIATGNAKSKVQAVQVAAKPKEMEEKSHPAVLRNSMKHPVDLSYEGRYMRLSPRERVKVANYEKLGKLPKGVFLIKM